MTELIFYLFIVTLAYNRIKNCLIRLAFPFQCYVNLNKLRVVHVSIDIIIISLSAQFY